MFGVRGCFYMHGKGKVSGTRVTTPYVVCHRSRLFSEPLVDNILNLTAGYGFGGFETRRGLIQPPLYLACTGNYSLQQSVHFRRGK